MGVKPMSSSASFTTYNLPPTRQDDAKDNAFGHRAFGLLRPKGNNGSNLFRFLLCSRPCSQHPSEHVQHGGEATVDLEEEEGLDRDEDWNVRLELESVMRHLEVRWQLFDEALSRFGDLEAMLAICADKVRWRHYTADGVKEAQIAEILNSLISRKLSMEVSINRVTKLSTSGELGASSGREGDEDDDEGQLQFKKSLQVQAALHLFHESRQHMRNDRLRSSRLCVLEQDTYTLYNKTGQVVEAGLQVVIWEQYNATWYICGCVSYPSTEARMA